MPSKHDSSHQKVLLALAFVGLVAVLIPVSTGASTLYPLLLLMLMSYASNASYSMVSRSSVRNSGLYHAFTILFNNALFYGVLHTLVDKNLALSLFVPYTVATVFGSVNGSQMSMKVESYFGITADPNKKAPPTRQSILAKKVLWAILGLGMVAVVYFAENLWTSLMIASFMFLDNSLHTVLRRARNSDNVAFHVGTSLAKSAVWFFLFRELAMGEMAFVLFVPYCFGSVSGGLFGQQVAKRIEKAIGATADGHLDSGSWNFIPWNTIFALGAMSAIFFVWQWQNLEMVLWLSALAMGQQVAFSLVSRSRNRSNLAYHAIASIFSNGIWFLTFRQLEVGDWTILLYIPFAIWTTMGSILGVGISMTIEKWLKATSDVVVKRHKT